MSSLPDEVFPQEAPVIETGYKPKIGPDRLAWAINLFSYADDTPFKPNWWQSHYLKSDETFFIANKSRRIGWSYITALKGLATALDPAISGYTKQYVSYSLDDATEKIRIAQEFYDSIPEIARPKKLVSRTRTHLEFIDLNGRSISRLISLPCKQPRGKGGDISLDEYAFHQKDGEIYTASIAVISRGGNLEIGSTPFGNKGRFFEILTDRAQYKNYKRYNVPWYYSPALCVNVEEAIKDKESTTGQRVERYGTIRLQEICDSMPLEDFQQEYECLFRDELAAFITLAMIQNCTPTGDDEIPAYRTLDEFILSYDPAVHGSLYAGYDVGRTNDKAELTILGYYPSEEIKTVWCCVSLKNTGFEKQQDMLSRMLTQLPVHRLAIDSTGLGMETGERMVKKFGKKVEACTFTNEFKEDIANIVWMDMDRRALILPADRDLHEQIHSIKKIVTSGKHARFDCDSNSRHHADRWWSLALADYAVSSGPAQSRGQFYKQLAERKAAGTVRTSNPRVILNQIARAYKDRV